MRPSWRTPTCPGAPIDTEVERVPKGEICDFPVRIRTWGKQPWWNWERNGRLVHEVFFPDLVSKWSANGKSFWTIDEGWDYVWLNRDGSAFIEGTGTHFWVHNKRLRYRQYGTWHLLFGAEPGEALYEKYFHDETSVWDGTIDDTLPRGCRYLAKKT